MGIKNRINNLVKEIEEKLPHMEEVSEFDETNLVVLHQDSFAADYQEDEYRLLGMVIKYLGITGKEIRIIGTNRETLENGRN